MNSLAVRSNLVDAGSDITRRLGCGGRNDRPICPKPRRLSPAIPDFLKPPSCNKHSQQNCDAKIGELNIITEKAVDGVESLCACCCSPSCYSGSPPSRTDNPLVHDVQFIQQMRKLSDNFNFTPASSR